MGMIIETKNHYEVLCVLHYVNSKYNTNHTKHEFGSSKVKFVHIDADGNVSYIRTFKTAAKFGKIIHTFPTFVNSIIAENNDLQLQIDNLHKELRDSFNKLAIAEADAEERKTKFKEVFKL